MCNVLYIYIYCVWTKCVYTLQSLCILYKVCVYSTKCVYTLQSLCLLYKVCVYSTKFVYTLQSVCILYKVWVYSTKCVYTLQSLCILYCWNFYDKCFYSLSVIQRWFALLENDLWCDHMIYLFFKWTKSD